MTFLMSKIITNQLIMQQQVEVKKKISLICYKYNENVGVFLFRFSLMYFMDSSFP